MSSAERPQRPKVVVTRRLLPETEQRLSDLFDVEFNLTDTPFDRARLAEAMQRADVLVPTITDEIDAELIAGAGDQLKLIANFGVGVDHIDLKAARQRKIIVTNTPGAYSEDAAEMAMALILSVPRRLAEAAKVIRSGEWRGWSPTSLLGHRIQGKTLGIIGMGRIGSTIARQARAFDLHILYHNRHRLPEAVEKALGARYVADLDDMLAASDIVSVNCPHTDQTHHLLNAARLRLIGPTGHLINTARGEIVDEAALISALEKGELAGAGLDVFEHEPAVNPRLLACDNVVLLPHIGSATVEGRTASGALVIANIQSWKDGHRPPDQVLEGWI
jgi:glyoxylate reductase